MMNVIENYYKTLEKIYVIHVRRAEIEADPKRIRPDYLPKFYMNIERRIKELLEENSELGEEDVPRFKHEVKKYYQNDYFHNVHFFLSLLYKE